jgi:hypothetical protein
MQPKFNQISPLFFSSIFVIVSALSVSSCGYSDKEEKQINQEAVAENDTNFDAMMGELGLDSNSQDSDSSSSKGASVQVKVDSTN